MTVQRYLELFAAIPMPLKINQRQSDQFYALTNAIDALSHSERIVLREALTLQGVKDLPRNLYFDYDKQVWIGEL